MARVIRLANFCPTEGNSHFVRCPNGSETHLRFATCSASGCPIANRNKLRILESGGTIEQHKAAIAAATAMKFDPTNCPTTGCDGMGHINGTFLTHR